MDIITARYLQERFASAQHHGYELSNGISIKKIYYYYGIVSYGSG